MSKISTPEHGQLTLYLWWKFISGQMNLSQHTRFIKHANCRHTAYQIGMCTIFFVGSSTFVLWVSKQPKDPMIQWQRRNDTAQTRVDTYDVYVLFFSVWCIFIAFRTSKWSCVVQTCPDNQPGAQVACSPVQRHNSTWLINQYMTNNSIAHEWPWCESLGQPTDACHCEQHFFVQRRELWQGDARGDGEKTLFITF